MVTYVLPQNDNNPSRQIRLSQNQAVYGYNMDYGVPVSSAFQAADDNSPLWQIDALKALYPIRMNLEALVATGRYQFQYLLDKKNPLQLVQMLKGPDHQAVFTYYAPDLGVILPGSRPSSIDDYKNIFISQKIPPVYDHYATDEGFAYTFLAGPNPAILQRMTQIPGNFPITSTHLTSVTAFAGDSLDAAIADGRVFYIDHSDLAVLNNGKHPQQQKYIYAPFAAFAVPKGGGHLYPFAIQCGPTPTGRRIYTPADNYSWKIAKNCVLAAHNTHHEVVSHLGVTHLLIEPIMLAAKRQLSVSHPINALLSEHNDGTMAINHKAIYTLIQPGQAVDRLIGADLQSTYAYLGAKRLGYSFRGNYLPSRLAANQTADTSRLTVYPYRDDGMLVWNAIQTWMSDFVRIFYPNDGVVQADKELQAWAAEIASPNAGRVKDFGNTPGTIQSTADLRDILTMIIFTAGPQHAAVNFAQGTDMAYLPANPLAGYTPEPQGTGHTEQDYLNNLPPIDVAVIQYSAVTFLGSMYYTQLGNYSQQFSSSSGTVGGAIARFKSNLADINATIDSRNQSRIPYPHLKPSNIPQSINI